jgi:hypothetical protein
MTKYEIMKIIFGLKNERSSSSPTLSLISYEQRRWQLGRQLLWQAAWISCCLGCRFFSSSSSTFLLSCVLCAQAKSDEREKLRCFKKGGKFE